MCSLINKQLLLTAYAYLFIMEQQKEQQGSEARMLRKILWAKKTSKQSQQTEQKPVTTLRFCDQAEAKEICVGRAGAVCGDHEALIYHGGSSPTKATVKSNGDKTVEWILDFGFGNKVATGQREGARLYLKPRDSFHHRLGVGRGRDQKNVWLKNFTATTTDAGQTCRFAVCRRRAEACNDDNKKALRKLQKERDEHADKMKEIMRELGLGQDDSDDDKLLKELDNGADFSNELADDDAKILEELEAL